MSIHDTAKIHPSAIINDGAVIGAFCKIGPFSVIGANVVLGRYVVIKSHVIISGRTVIGEETIVFPFASIGEIPQDLKYNGEATRLEIGKRNKIRENVTMNLGTSGGGGITKVGDDCLFMTGAHVGHDVQIGNRIVIANQSALADPSSVSPRAVSLASQSTKPFSPLSTLRRRSPATSVTRRCAARYSP